MLANQLKIEKREAVGKRKLKTLRDRGMIPGVVYGHGQETVSVAFDGKEFSTLLKHGARVIDIALGKDVEKAVIREVQFDHLGLHVIHVDFARVSADERIKVDVPVELRGISPGVASGGVLEHLLHSLHIEALATAVPESIRVRIDELQKGMSIHVRELKLPEGVKVLNDPDAVVLHVVEPKVVAATTPLEGGPAEPEVVTKKKPAEEKKED